MFNPIKSQFISKFVLFKPQSYFPGQLKAAIEQKCHYYYASNRPLNLKLKNVTLDKYVMYLEREYNLLKAPDLNLKQSEKHRMQELQCVVNILQNRYNIIKDLENLKDLLEDDDAEIKGMAEQERNIFEDKITETEQQLLQALLPVEVCDNRGSIMLEVNTGVGGQEAMLFAKELFYMYCSFAQYKKWNVEIVGYLTTEAGGIRHATALINGQHVFKYFKHEGGVHRVQRIPATEKMGRIHTSTVSVLVLPEPTDIEVVIDNKDLRIETKRASGAGGQHVNTTDSAVRITHIPSGVSVECQNDRSQIKNRKVAMQKLRSILFDQQLRAQNEALASTKKLQVNSNFRNEKIRTYNFNQDRITDHRLESCSFHNLKTFLAGREPLESLMNRLYENARIENLLSVVTGLENK